MEITFKNNSGANKAKQCQQFLQILKKLKLLLSSKDRRLSFFVDKKMFIITTFAARNLQSPPAGCPSFYIDYEFGEDMYNLSDFAGNKPYVFCTDIDDTVRWTTHYYENKMSILQMKVQSSYNKGVFQFQVPQQSQGQVPLIIEKITQFPLQKDLNKDDIDRFEIFHIKSNQMFEKLKQIQDIKCSCLYEIHESGIYMKNYSGEVQGNNFLLKKQILENYDSINIKQKLKGNVYIIEPENFLLDEIRYAGKKHYRELKVNLIITHPPEHKQIIKHAYLEIQARLSQFSNTKKRTICHIDISAEMNQQGMIIQQNATSNVNLLKNQEPPIEGLRRAILNKWVHPRVANYQEEMDERDRQRLGVDFIRDDMLEETVTRKVFFKIEEKD